MFITNCFFLAGLEKNDGELLVFEKVEYMTTSSAYVMNNVTRMLEDIILWSDIEEDCAAACHEKITCAGFVHNPIIGGCQMWHE